MEVAGPGPRNVSRRRKAGVSTSLGIETNRLQYFHRDLSVQCSSDTKGSGVFVQDQVAPSARKPKAGAAGCHGHCNR